MKVCILDDVKINLRSRAGYIRYIPFGVSNLFFRIRPVREQAKLPPAESPAITIYFGRIFRYF